MIDVLLHKLNWAIEDTKIKTLVCSGGVAANTILRDRLKKMAEEKSFNVSYPSIEFCTDNAAMIAFAGYVRKKYNLRSYNTSFARPRWPLGELYD